MTGIADPADVPVERMAALRRSWQRAWRGMSATDDSAATFDALIAAYGEPQRSYHTLQHLGECLDLFDGVEHLARDAAAVELALWFHDAVYDVRRSDNEERSADWAQAALKRAGAARRAVERVHALVMATRHSVPATGPDEALLVDIDLAILGADVGRFTEYERQIREEYAFVPEAVFSQKRRAILKSFLDRERVYGTAHFHGLLEERARKNLRAAVGQGAG